MGTASAAAWSPGAAAQGCPQVRELPDGQDSLSCTIEDWGHADPWYVRVFADGVAVSETTFLVKGSGPIEVIFTLEETIEDDLPGGSSSP